MLNKLMKLGDKFFWGDPHSLKSLNNYNHNKTANVSISGGDDIKQQSMHSVLSDD